MQTLPAKLAYRSLRITITICGCFTHFKTLARIIMNTVTAVRIGAVANPVKSADFICKIFLTLVSRGPFPATVVARFLPALVLDGGDT